MNEDDLAVHHSCGNVFADMGMHNAEKRLAKAEAARLARNASRDAYTSDSVHSTTSEIDRASNEAAESGRPLPFAGRARSGER